ncbi:hypothetical protein FVE85_5246 [Porphyridium purpureum]|uniref:Uncharacterized protein n=1 Tax=Porphyridium purpureum TaxID=35688 RepID=A0A5J4Z1F1_PORPP|nr:hypothetical protein FVE85_5246 [Porphyridium purpureum]|eukprot:POR6224..scf295_1
MMDEPVEKKRRVDDASVSAVALEVQNGPDVCQQGTGEEEGDVLEVGGLSLCVGTRLVVAWDLVRDLEGTSEVSTGGGEEDAREEKVGRDERVQAEQRECVWWGCELLRVTDEQELGKPVCVVLYDKHEEYEPEESKCVFLSETLLWDCSSKTELTFALEEDEFDNPHDELMVRIAEKPSVSCAEVCDLQDAIDARWGINSVEAGMDEFAKLPLSQQSVLADRWRSFADKVKERMVRFGASKGDSYVMTRQDMEHIVSEVRVELRAEMSNNL